MINPDAWPLADRDKLFSYLGWNSYCSKRYKLLYVATPKVACTSLKWWFADLEGYSKTLFTSTESAESAPELIIHDTFQKVAPSVTGLTPLALTEPLQSDEYFRFALVRNPYKRIFSAWQSKLLLREPLQVKPYLKCDFFHLPISSSSDIAQAFEGFLEYLASQEISNYGDVHWTPQATLLRPDLISYTKLAQIEHVHELQLALSAHLGHGVPDPFITHSKNESLIPYLPEFITARSAELICSLYAEDFKVFDYDLKKPETRTQFPADRLKVALKAISLIRGRHQRLDEIRKIQDVQIAEINQAITEQKRIITEQSQINTEQKQIIIEQSQTNTEQKQIIIEQSQTNTEQKQIIIEQSQTNTEQKQIITTMLNSNSLRLTKPFRAFKKYVIDGFFIKNWQKFSRLHQQSKFKLKYFLLRAFRYLSRNYPFLRTWIKATPKLGNFTFDQIILAPEKISYTPLLQAKPLDDKPVKLICFYLPQFHPIPENDAWWGKDFTEWTNVKPARPQFKDHYQPHEPDELGYYNLLDSEVQHRQVELAKLYGIEGFCFYFYWFGGKRLLEKPVENYLNDSSLELPFCLCWANENWTRNWDGFSNKILIQQQHSTEDNLAFIRHVARYMRDPRYIRINDKPLLLVYRPSLLPSAKETVQLWRDWCRHNNIGEIYLAYTQSFENENPNVYGFDAAIEFPPNNSNPPDITQSVKPIKKDFACTVYDWRAFVERSFHYSLPEYVLFRSVCPSWDNTARRKNQSTIFVNSSPPLYQQWLENAINYTNKQFKNPDEKLIFVNAWNEWAEGAYLEPNSRYGYGYLQATRDALKNSSNKTYKNILIVTHDCAPHGGQYLILETARQFKICGIEVSILALGGGKLLNDFQEIGETLVIAESDKKELHGFLEQIRAKGTINAVTNTVVCGAIVPLLKNLGFQVISLIHELPNVIQELMQEDNAKLIAQYSDRIVFPANVVHQEFIKIAPVAHEKIIVQHQGVLRKNPYKETKKEAHRIICDKHKLPIDTKIVLAVAYIDFRKGPDYFVEVAAEVLKTRPKTTFIWIGHAEKKMEKKVISRVQELHLEEKILFVGFNSDPLVYYAAASVYALTSREDPFPNVVLESAEVGVPVVAFENTTGASEYIQEHGGRLAKFPDTNDFANHVSWLLTNPNEHIPSSDSSLRKYALDLLHYISGFPRISVVVPNYNYEQYISERLNSIRNQTFPVYEVLILDDASNDNSVKVLKDYLKQSENEAKLTINSENSGSVFIQWEKGIKECAGDLVWIAEADDLSDIDFLEKLAPSFNDPKVVLSFCQSKQIDESGKVLEEDYLQYTKGASDIGPIDCWRSGHETIRKSMCIKNTIPNVSAVLFRRQTLHQVISEIREDLFKLRIAGDWLVYLNVLMKGEMHYCKDSLNLHRRHNGSVTKSSHKKLHLDEVIQLQKVAISLAQPPDEIVALAENYVTELHNHFQLP